MISPFYSYTLYVRVRLVTLSFVPLSFSMLQDIKKKKKTSSSSVLFPPSDKQRIPVHTQTCIVYTSGKHVRAMNSPFDPTFIYIVKLGYAEVYLFFLFLLQNIECGYSLEPPRRGGSNVYPQSMF